MRSHAGLELVFQLEEGETLTEPVPTRDRRRAILAFEATEGGAGVLGRSDNRSRRHSRASPERLLSLMHYREHRRGDRRRRPSVARKDPKAQCVKGCYRCLLSYYNQPDHEHIDRTDADVLRTAACAWPAARSSRPRVKRAAAGGLTRGSRLDVGAYRRRMANRLIVDGAELPLVWRAPSASPPISAQSQIQPCRARGLGFMCDRFPIEPGDTPPPAELAELLGVHS